MSPATEVAVAEAVAFRLNPKPWITKDGHSSCEVSEMEGTHIQHCITLLQNPRMKRLGCSGLTNAQWLQVFRNELVARAHLVHQNLEAKAAR